MRASSSIWHSTNIRAKIALVLLPLRILKRACSSSIRTLLTGVLSFIFIFFLFVALKCWPSGPDEEW